MTTDIRINIHSVIPRSKINGPGDRMVIFFQGCSRGCPGCFNPLTHTSAITNLYSPEDFFKLYPPDGIEGLTMSGGEPFQQAGGLRRLLEIAKKNHGLSTVVYTGFSYKELKSNSAFQACFKFIDVLVDGMFVESKKEPALLARGSTNQDFHFLTSRYRKEDFYMPGKMEVIIGRDGLVTETGFGKAGIKIN